MMDFIVRLFNPHEFPHYIDTVSTTYTKNS